MAITIPKQYREGLAAVSNLDGDSFSDMYEALRQAPSELPSYTDLAAFVAEHVNNIGDAEIKKIVEVLASLYQVRVRSNVSAGKLAKDVYEAIRKEDSGLIEEANQLNLKAWLEKFLGVTSLNVLASKAKELQGDVERAFCDARILTDLRPLFGTDLETPKAMIIVHTLKLAYHDAATGKHEELFVSVDDEDIRKLKQVLERAERKAKGLLSRLRLAGIKTVDFS